MTQPTYAITANSLTAETFRQAPASHIAGAGVVGSGDLAVAQNGTPNMSVNVAAGQVWVPGTLSSTTGFPTNLNAQTAYGLPSTFNEQGSYFQWYSGTTNLAISAADPTNPRIDLAVVSIQDAQYSGSNNQGILQIITGTPAPSPSAPAAPASSVVLAQIAVAAGASSIVTANITDKRPVLMPTLPHHPYRSLVTASSSQSFTNNTSIAMVFQNVESDPLGIMAIGTGTATIPVAGIYAVTGHVAINMTSTALTFQLWKNGGSVRQSLPNLTNPPTAIISTIVSCAVGDVLKFVVNQTSGSTQSSFADATQNWGQIVLLSLT